MLRIFTPLYSGVRTCILIVLLIPGKLSAIVPAPVELAVYHGAGGVAASGLHCLIAKNGVDLAGHGLAVANVQRFGH